MTTKFLYQAHPSGPVVEFSDRPAKVDGVTYTFNWPISAGYRKWFHQNLAKVKDTPVRRRNREISYLAFIANRHGLANPAEARGYLHAQGLL